MTAKTKTIKQKLFFSAMALAFIWVIVGDLVSIHLTVYFGEIINSSWHHPFAKTHKDDNTFKVQKHKTDGSSKVKPLSFNSSNGFYIHHASSDYYYFDANTQILHFQDVGYLFLRGPPSLV